MDNIAFEQQVTDLRKQRMAEQRDETKAKAGRDVGRDRAALKHANKLQIARRIARELGANGPICIDDVTDRMVELGYESDADVDTKQRRFWKGKVFTTKEWVAVDSVPSRRTSHHARPVTLWALKSWIEQGVDGEEFPKVSSFHVIKIRSNFARANPHVDMLNCKWFIGMDKLSPNLLETMKADKYKLYGTPVQLIPGAVGAILQAPNVTV